MITNLGRKVTAIAVTLAAASAALLWPGRPPIPLGLDLKGGSRLVYKIDLDQAVREQRLSPQDAQDPSRVLDLQRQIIQDRVDSLGLRDIPIQMQGGDEILIELPGMGKDEVDNIKRIIESLGELEFRIVADSSKGDSVDLAAERKKLDDWLAKNPDLSFKFFNLVPEKEGGPRAGYRWYPETGKTPAGPNLPKPPAEYSLIRLEKEEAEGKESRWVFRGTDLAYAIESPEPDPVKGLQVLFGMKEHRKADFEAFTRANKGRQMAIILNGEIRSAPVIEDVLPGQGRITGNFKKEEVQALTKVLTTGSLPVKPELQSEITVGASLGEDAIERAKLATWITMVLIPAFMIVYYGGSPFWFSSGVIASLGLLVNLFLILGAMAFFRATLTLPGIGGLILTVGMAVDANILIYERIREEIERGRGLLQAAINGFDRAAGTIIDSNLTTLISGLILFWMGSGPVKGFAVTLCIGIVSTLFSTLLLSKVLFHVGLTKGWIRSIRYQRLFANPSWKFLRYKWLGVVGSVLFIGWGLFEFATVDDNTKLGLDFTGGAIVRVQLKEPTPIEEVRARVTKVYETAAVTMNQTPRANFAKGLSDEFTVKFKLSEEQRAAVEAGKEPAYVDELRSALHGILLDEGIADLKVERGQGASSTASFALHLVREADEAKLRSVLSRSGDLREIKLAKLGESGRAWSVTGTVPVTVEAGALRASLLGGFVQAAASKDPQAPKLVSPFPEHSRLGSRVVRGLRDQAILAMLFAFLGIVLYVRFRFHEYRWGIGGIVAIVHDVAVAVGAVVLAQSRGWVSAEIDLTMLAAFLTIIGYSINDTIVIFDRMRENAPRTRAPMEEIMDLSISQTLSRTILTATTVMAVVSVMFAVNFGRGNVLEGFAFAMMVGTVVGCYSSVYVASPVVLFFIWKEERRKLGKSVNPVAQAKTPAPK